MDLSAKALPSPTCITRASIGNSFPVRKRNSNYIKTANRKIIQPQKYIRTTIYDCTRFCRSTRNYLALSRKNRLIRSETFFIFYVTAIESICLQKSILQQYEKKKQQLLRHTCLHPICKTLHFFKHISTNPPIKAVSVILLIMQPLVSIAKYVSSEFIFLGENYMLCGDGSFGGQ